MASNADVLGRQRLGDISPFVVVYHEWQTISQAENVDKVTSLYKAKDAFTEPSQQLLDVESTPFYSLGGKTLEHTRTRQWCHNTRCQHNDESVPGQ